MAPEKNTVIETTIDGIGINGEGIARIDGMPVFVPYTLPGERVRIKIVAVKNSYAYGKLIDVITPADERAREECPVYSKCGGCQLQHLKYKDQLAFKTVILRDTLKKVGNITANVPTCYKSENTYGYRNKLQLPIGINRQSKAPEVGFYANNSHRIVGINTCPLHPDWNEKLISIIKKFMTKYLVMGYDEATHTGTIRHIVARQVAKTLQIIIVINGETLKCSGELVDMICEVFERPSVFLNVNTAHTNVILGEKYIRLVGEPYIVTTDMGHRIAVSPDSFLQVNDYVKTKLYNKALEVSGVSGEDVVVDAYCGIGILTAMFAERAKFTYGVEISAAAIANANYMLEQNSLGDKLEFFCGDCEEEIDGLLKRARQKTSERVILIMDPPRKGVERSIIDTVLTRLPDTVIYISCNPATLARDLGMLTGTIDMEGYRTDTPKYEIANIQPYDMFPQTKHLETLVCLNRIKHNI